MNITGCIAQKQSITGTVKVTSISGAVGDVVHISGTVSHQTQRLTGIVKNPSHVHGIISKPSYEHRKSDHVFVIVDLLKLYAADMQMQTSQLKISLPATNLSLDNATVTEI